MRSQKNRLRLCRLCSTNRTYAYITMVAKCKKYSSTKMRRSFSQTRWYHQVIENFQFLQVRSIAEYIVAESIVYKKISSDIRWHAKRCGQYIRTLNNRVTRYLDLKRSVDIKAHPFEHWNLRVVIKPPYPVALGSIAFSFFVVSVGTTTIPDASRDDKFGIMITLGLFVLILAYY